MTRENRMNEKKTAGELVAQADSSYDEHFYEDYLEFRKINSKNLWNDIVAAIEDEKKKPFFSGKDFFIILLHVIDAGLRRPVNKIWIVPDCPTPVYKQSVFKFHHEGQRIEFLWSIPTKNMVDQICANPYKYLFDKTHGEWPKMCLLYKSGELHKWAKKQLGNKIDGFVLSHKKEGE